MKHTYSVVDVAVDAAVNAAITARTASTSMVHNKKQDDNFTCLIKLPPGGHLKKRAKLVSRFIFKVF